MAHLGEEWFFGCSEDDEVVVFCFFQNGLDDGFCLDGFCPEGGAGDIEFFGAGFEELLEVQRAAAGIDAEGGDGSFVGGGQDRGDLEGECSVGAACDGDECGFEDLVAAAVFEDDDVAGGLLDDGVDF